LRELHRIIKETTPTMTRLTEEVAEEVQKLEKRVCQESILAKLVEGVRDLTSELQEFTGAMRMVLQWLDVFISNRNFTRKTC
jgi:flagellar biosynthesis/type III secretory pathway chaperone